MKFLELTKSEKELDERMNGLLQVEVDMTLHNRSVPTDDKYKHLEVQTEKYELDGKVYRKSVIYGTNVLDEEDRICEISECSYDDSKIWMFTELPSDLLMLISDYSRGEQGLDEHWV